jgi:hypothetical protein
MNKQTIVTVSGFGYCIFLNYMYFKTVINDLENKSHYSLKTSSQN